MKLRQSVAVVAVLAVVAAAGIGLLESRLWHEEPVATYSLWLSPSGDQYAQLQSTVDRLADKYPSHHFMPHLTVIGGLKGTLPEVTAAARRIADKTHVLEAPIEGITWEAGDVWRSFYLEVADTPEFSKLYDDTLQITGKEHAWPYHFSLMYTKLGDVEKTAIREELHRAGLPMSITLDRIRICTSGDVPEEWTCPAEVKLSNHD